MDKPSVTRLRYVSSKNPGELELYLSSLGVRVQVYGQPIWDGKRWYLWFVPNDIGADIPSRDL